MYTVLSSLVAGTRLERLSACGGCVRRGEYEPSRLYYLPKKTQKKRTSFLILFA